MARRRSSSAQSVPDDYLSLAQMRLDLRLDDDGFDDDALSRYRADAIALVSRLTGCSLLSLTVGQIDAGLRHAVSVAAHARFESMTDVPPALYALTGPYRSIVPVDDAESEESDDDDTDGDDSGDDDSTDTEDFGMFQSTTYSLTDGQVLTVDVRRARLPFSWLAQIDDGATLQLERSFRWPATAADWVSRPVSVVGMVQAAAAFDGSKSIERGESSPVSGLRFSVTGGGASVIFNYSEHGSIAGTVT